MNKILLSISDEENRKRLSKLILKSGYALVELKSSEAFLESVKTSDPDLIVVDGRLVEQFGEKVRQDFPQKHLIAWMNEKNSRLAVQMILNGAFDCLSAPVQEEEVIGVLDRALNHINSCTEPLVEKKKVFSFLPVIAGTLALAAAVALYFFISSFQGDKSKSYSLSHQNPTGIFRSESFLWTADWYTQSVYNYKIGKELKSNRTYYFQNLNPSSIAYASGMLWIGGTDGLLRNYELTNDEPILKNAFKLPSNSPSAICPQDEYLWIADTDGAIYQLLLKKPEQVIAKYQYPGIMPVGLFWDGRNFWSADGKAGKIYKHSGPTESFKILSTFSLSVEGGGNLAGISGDKHFLWLIYSGAPSKILKYPVKNLR
ncbi:MAG TPA: hypothetical protein DEE98_07835 [Elusimicrobia bacterium]|nr:MAG: hypothetical protein A2278_00670 [Elusimicrobia bacterium RIFOXYA12_FULL_49_49]OGS09970.1 MAG: hypothetical protein A2204_06035 [Elusimicrobia bacterium RIFOXYA1_FULL_47_7]OGS10995.1 MAG: hypothetical protein A2386_00235 [Elusimicrobia bacterium RIFOXYB1_FULL_48_9]OGS15169.1 MAG: hypothetical protein A2251_00680 [Elusimicrobia bacterium RIFOXYA2_FULL_47_53]OGS29789.1 MAG: hypothetical protein A2323_01480 [Elusimicrobia bacterium RIFOXYB2_FULL_46_23]HBU70272.1 hypothetical protein [Elus